MDINFRATAYIEDKELSICGTLKECSEWADEIMAQHLKELKEIKIETIKDEKEK